MEQHVNTLLSVYGEDLNRLRNRVGKDRSEHTFRAMKMGRGYVDNKPQLSYARDVFVFAAGFWVIRTSPPRRFMPKSPCRN